MTTVCRLITIFAPFLSKVLVMVKQSAVNKVNVGVTNNSAAQIIR